MLNWNLAAVSIELNAVTTLMPLHLLTPMNPPLDAASLEMYHWLELGPQIPKRSPGMSPSCSSPAARRSA